MTSEQSDLTIVGTYEDLTPHNQTAVAVATTKEISEQEGYAIRDKMHTALEAENIGLDIVQSVAAGGKVIVTAFFEPILDPGKLGTAYAVMTPILDREVHGAWRGEQGGVAEIRIQEKSS